MKGLTEIAGIKVGHATDPDARTGCTAILCEAGAVAGVDIGGAATGSQELDVLSPMHASPGIHGILLAGGSAYGLEAASGVRRFLEKKGAGFAFGGSRIPLVPGLILFDLAFAKPGVRPTREMGELAAAAASDGPVAEGNVGAGTGATVGKLFGMARAMKGGIGSYAVACAGATVAALAAVNAFGDVRDAKTGQLVAGCRVSATGRELLGTERAMLRGERRPGAGGNTTLVVVATNARLSKIGATRLARMAQAGVLRTLSPGHTMVDGDTVIAVSAGSAEEDLNALGVAAAEAVAESIVRAVRLAKSMNGVPGLG